MRGSPGMPDTARQTTGGGEAEGSESAGGNAEDHATPAIGDEEQTISMSMDLPCYFKPVVGADEMDNLSGRS